MLVTRDSWQPLNRNAPDGIQILQEENPPQRILAFYKANGGNHIYHLSPYHTGNAPSEAEAKYHVYKALQDDGHTLEASPEEMSGYKEPE